MKYTLLALGAATILSIAVIAQMVSIKDQSKVNAASSSGQSSSTAVSAKTKGQPAILVQFKDGVSENDKKRVREKVGVVLKDRPLENSGGPSGLEVVTVRGDSNPTEKTVANIIKKLESDPKVEFAEMNVSYKTQKSN